MQLTGAHRAREITQWSEFKKLYNDGTFDDKDPDTHQLQSYKKIMKNRENTLSPGSSQPEIFNVLGQKITIDRIETERKTLKAAKRELGKKLPRKEGNVGFGGKNKIDHKIRRNKISWIPFSKAKWMYSKLEHWMHTVNNKHMGFNALQIGEYAQFTKYSKKEHYDWHVDSSDEMSKSPPVRKMSMILLLNDPKEFKGGELQIVDKKKLMALKQGYGVFFASFIAHRVVFI